MGAIKKAPQKAPATPKPKGKPKGKGPQAEPEAGALVIETWETSRLAPYVDNPRKNDHAVEQMVAAIQEFGFKVPIIARSSGEVVDGHLRLKAAIAMKRPTVPVVLADDLSEVQVRAFRILANKSAEWAEWDSAKLGEEIAALTEADYDLGHTGFDEVELGGILSLEPAGESGPAYEPNLTPTADTRPVTTADTTKAADGLGQNLQDRAQQNLVEVTCPHCAETYHLNKDTL